MACRILVPWPGIELVPCAVKAWSLNHWSVREVFILLSFKKKNTLRCLSHCDWASVIISWTQFLTHDIRNVIVESRSKWMRLWICLACLEKGLSSRQLEREMWRECRRVAWKNEPLGLVWGLYREHFVRKRKVLSISFAIGTLNSKGLRVNLSATIQVCYSFC